MKKRRLSIILFSSFMFLSMAFISNRLEAQVTITEEEWVLPTYPIGPPDKNPSFFKSESYQGASRHFYPYTLNDNFSNEKVEKAWKALILENEYIKLCVTPEIGGKIYYATDKSNNYNFLYKNDVVKPANIGMTGAWVSGGIEWNVLHHHRASSYLPMDYELVENKDGSKTIWIGETEQRHRMRWTVGITSFPGKSYFQAEMKIHNPTPFTQSFLYWANVATHTNENYQAIFPPSVQFATYHTKNDFTHWPISKEIYRGQDYTKGVDISWWKNGVTPNSFFAHDLKEDFMGGYDHGKESGTIHIGNHNIVKGAKLWEWGSGTLGQSIEAQLNENAGPYVELMVGTFSDNQPDYSWIRPYEVKTVRQYWYPVKDIEGFKNANLNGAVNLEKREGNNIFLGYYSTQKVDKARIMLQHKGEVISDKTIEISPKAAFTQTIKMGGAFNITDLYTEMVNTETGEVLVAYQPLEIPYIDELPETYKDPQLPSDIPTTEELFLTGNRIEQFYNPSYDPLDYYKEALQRDPNDIRTNTAVGNIFLRNGDYDNARKYFSAAIKRLTGNYTRPSNCEALYLQGITLKALGLHDEAADTLYRATWDYAFHAAAYLELARISSIRNDYSRALDEINESLATNARNNSAICFKAAIQRKLGKYDDATITLRPILDSDPLDIRAANESYLLARTSDNKESAPDELALLTKKMRDFDQNYLELAIGYINDGLPEEAEEVLLRYNGKNPIISYYLGFLSVQKENMMAAEKYFRDGSEQSVDYCFPFRLETIEVLKTALEYNPSDAKAHYYLGNILFEKQPDKGMESWENAVKYDPGLAIAYRNLGWGYYEHLGDGSAAINAYEKALELNKKEPIFYSELDHLYEISNAPMTKRLNLFEGNNEVVSKREDAFARQITVLTLAGKADKAVEYLSKKAFTFNEGSQKAYDITADAYLLSGIDYLKNKSFQKALESFRVAKVPDELAIRGEHGNKNIQVIYYLGLAYQGLGNTVEAKNHFNSCNELKSRNSGYILYYQGLSNQEVGNKTKSKEIFNAMVKEGEEQISQITSEEVDSSAKFGEKENRNVRLANAYLLKGLGYKGLGNNKLAAENLKKSYEHSENNPYANVELQNL